ncbi:endonuclease/exonuclease/phosphatase family protein [Muribaculum intestinale]|mgnify:FL=1|jgi:endonuclease/exonuclease/phosphatase (EEP) superfamily protein YafD|uniref:endonuclease/exonuclease/phosphatase family protein n=2 Tax=Muribaculum intestinale TaxID=1796646 RepID=UPI00242A85F1|nr:endonuclease/exonuclease/phosphatase family protein [Muribaculum intestinale]
MNINPISRLIRFGILAFDILVAAGLLLSAYGGAIDPNKSVWPQIFGMTFPAWIILMLVMVPVSFIIWRKSALLPTAALLIAMPAILTISPFHIGGALSQSERASSFSVMTYNVYGFVDHEFESDDSGGKGAKESRSLQQIIDTQPDIVCIQEGYNPNYRFKLQMDTINKIYPYSNFIPEGGEIIFSKYPFKIVPTPQPAWHTAHYSAYELDVDGHPLLVVNCHLQSIGLTPDDKALYRELTDKRIESPTRSELSKVKNSILSKLAIAFKLRAEQARHIRQFLEEHPGNAILVGDFNDVQGNYAYRCICSAGMRDAYADSGFGPTITYIDNRFYFHIDQIFYRGDMRAVDIVRGDIKSSDHYPMTATFVWNAPDISHTD